MDLPNLAIVLQAALSPNPAERTAAEASLNQVYCFWLRMLSIDYVWNGWGFTIVAVVLDLLLMQ